MDKRARRTAGLFAALLVLCCSGIVVAQTPTPLLPPPLSADFYLPRPAPTAPLAHWQAAGGRKTISLSIAGKLMRGYEYAASPSNVPVVLFFGDNSWTLDTVDPVLRDIAGRGGRVVAYDYRGFGFSEGRSDARAWRHDALLEYDALSAAPGDPHVVVFGFGFGTAVAAYVASERKVAGLALVAPISNAARFYKAFVGAHVPEMRDQNLITTPDADEVFDEVGLVAKSTAPLLVVHGDLDDIVPYAEGQEVFAATKSPLRTFVSLHGVRHNDAIDDSQTLASVGRFFYSVR